MTTRKNKIIVVYSSHLGEEEDNKFNNHISNTIGCKHDIVKYPNFNEFSLSEIYNKAIDEYNEDGVIFCYMHPDIIHKTKNWGRIILNKFNNTDFGIIGVAGSTFINNNSWWDDRSKMYGIVTHCDGIKEWTSEYSNPIKGIQSVVNIDGLFMAVDPERIKHKFDENYGKFHMYDLTFSVKNYLDGVNVGVITDIRILHKSIGETDQEWELNRQKFVEEYKDELPIRHISEDKLRVLICCQFFKNYTGSEMSNYELAKELVKQGCEVTVISTVVGDPILSKARKVGIDVYSLSNAPNYQLTQENQLMFIKNQKEFDIIHINHKPIGEQILKMYPNTPAVMHVRSEVIPVFEEPIIHPQIKKYISIRDSITDYIKSFNITEDKIVHIDNPFDTTRFNTDYERSKWLSEKESVLFIGTLDHLRKNILHDLVKMTRENNQELWIIGSDNSGYINELLDNHVVYLGVQPKVEIYLKRCHYTAGIFKGRTTIEGFLCGKSGWIYSVDKNGNIINKEFTEVPEDIEKYSSEYSAKKVIDLYDDVLNNF
ncbi:MAG: glycosyltransferase [bacterium]